MAAPKTYHAYATRRKQSRERNSSLRGPCKDFRGESNGLGRGQTVEDSRTSEESVVSSRENARHDDSVHEGSRNSRSRHLKDDGKRGGGCRSGREARVIVGNCSPLMSIAAEYLVFVETNRSSRRGGQRERKR